MGVRDWLGEHQRITLGFVTIVVVIAVGYGVYSVMGNRPAFQSKLPSLFYTIDDGKTFFVAGSENVPPFDYKGQPAVHAIVFECNGKRFVGYLERYTPAARKAILENRATPQTEVAGRELKKPGDTKWVKSNDFAAVARVTDVQCPDGQGGTPEQVGP